MRNKTHDDHGVKSSRKSKLRFIKLLISPIESSDHRRNRLLAILQGCITNFGNRIIGILVSFLSVPLTIGYLGRERYGVWLAIGSLLAWLSLSDFGLGNGLTNAITSAAGKERPDTVRAYVSNGVLILSVLAFIGAVITGIMWSFVNWNNLLGVKGALAQSEVPPAVAAAIAIFLLQFPFAISGKVLMAYQEGRIANYWGAAGNVLSLLALLVVTHTHGGLVLLVIALSGTSLFVNILCAIWLFSFHKPYLAPTLSSIDFSLMKPITSVGGQFFLIQIMALVTFQTDSLVIGHFIGASKVPDYNLTYKLFNYTGLPQSILFSYLWTAYNEAIARQDIAWVKKTFHLSLLAGMIFTSSVVIVLIFIANPFISWWSGGVVSPSLNLIYWMAGWSIINAFTNPIACLLAAASHLRAQLIYSAGSTICNIILSIYLVQISGAKGVIAATVISYLIFVCVPIFVDGELLLSRLSRKLS